MFLLMHTFKKDSLTPYPFWSEPPPSRANPRVTRRGDRLTLSVPTTVQGGITMSVTPDEVLDCSGLACPMPIIKTRKAIDGMQIGQVLKMISTDPGSVSDMDAWTRKTGHELLASEQEDGKHIFYVKKTK